MMKLWQPEGSPLAYALESFVNKPNTPYVIIAGIEITGFIEERYCINWFQIGDLGQTNIEEQLRKDLKNFGEIIGESSGKIRGKLSNCSIQGHDEICWISYEWQPMPSDVKYRYHVPSHPGWIDQNKKHPHKPMSNRSPEEILALFLDQH